MLLPAMRRGREERLKRRDVAVWIGGIGAGYSGRGGMGLCNAIHIGVSSRTSRATQHDGDRGKSVMNERNELNWMFGICRWIAKWSNSRTVLQFDICCLKTVFTKQGLLAFPSSASIHLEYELGRRYCSMTVRRMYNADDDKGIGFKRMGDLTPWHFGDVFWHELLWLLWHRSMRNKYWGASSIVYFLKLFFEFYTNSIKRNMPQHVIMLHQILQFNSS